MPKKCCRCKLTKNLKEFYKANGSQGRSGYCKECEKAKRYEYKYGITVEELSRLEQKQGGMCAICGRKSALVVDHDHKTGVVRGLLCNECNMALGLLGDDAWTLHSAADYLDGEIGEL